MTKSTLALAFACLNLAALAGSQSYDFKDPNGINKIVIRLDAPALSLSGTATNVAGSVTFDFDQPAALKGRIVVAAGSLMVNPGDARGLAATVPSMWLDAAKFPEIVFEASALENVKITDNTSNNFTANLTGVITMKGVSKKITMPVKIGYLAGRLRDRGPDLQGDLLRINANFTLQRSDFDPNPAPGMGADKVPNVIQVNMTISGRCPRQTDATAAPQN